MNRGWTFLPIALCLGMVAQNHVPDRSGTAPIYIVHVTVVDTETGGESQDRTVVLSGDRILDIRSSDGAAAPNGARVIDGRGKYLIPGLWDMHVHGTNYESTLPLYVANGVTGVREMFGPADANKVRAELAESVNVAPHLYLSSPIVDGNPPIWPNSIKVETPDEARRVVDQQKQRGADFIKVYSRLSREAYFAILDEARRQNLPVAGHVPAVVSAWEATEAKQRSIEHLLGIPFACSSREQELWPKAAKAQSMLEGDRLELAAGQDYDREKCSKLFQEFKSNGTWIVPTLLVYRTFGLLNDPEFRRDTRMRYFKGEFQDWLVAKDDPRLKSWTPADFDLERMLFTQHQGLVKELFHAGVPMLAGTDTGNPYCFPGFGLHDELELLVQSGMSPLGALQAATRNPAIFMNAADRYGSISKGKIADLLLLDADPLKDIHNTRRISEVFLAGRGFNRKALDAILASAEQAKGKEQRLW